MTLEIFSEREIRDIVQLYESGYNCTDISKIYFCHRTTVAEYLKNAGVTIRRLGSPKRIKQSELTLVARLYQSGHCPREISDMTGIRYEKVLYRIRESGIPRRNKSESALISNQYRNRKASRRT